MKFLNLLILILPLSLYAKDQISKEISLNDYLQQVQKNNRSFQMIEQMDSAASLRYGAADLSLSPVLTASGKYIDDKAQRPVTPTFIVDRQKSREYSLGLAKKFGATGTSASVSANVSDAAQDISSLGVSSSNSFARGGATVAVSQSLWKDSFGYGTRRRHEKEGHLTELEKSSVKLQKNQLLIEAESIYWDLLYAEKDFEIKKSSLERAKRLEKWMASRVSNGLGEKADLLGTQSLAATRELQVQISEDELIAAQKRIADTLEIDFKSLPKFSDDLIKPRRLEDYIEGSSQKIMRYDSYLAVLEHKAKSAGAKEAADSVRPDLSLEGMYATNNIENTIDTVNSKLTDQNRPTAAVGVKFTWLLDGDAKDSVAQTAKLDALSAELKKDRKLRESETGWSELVRRHKELSEKIDTAMKISDIQTRRATAERERFQKGRSITSNVITAEQDAQEAELTLNKLKTERRKLESQARMFLKAEL